MVFDRQPLHFTGIGGAGMSGLAEIMHQLGHTVRGSDLRLSTVTARLSALGVEVVEGHSASNVAPDASAVIYTSAATAGNPELQEARRRGLPLVLRGELLAELMRERRGVAVAGSHGKTTTSTMLATILIHAGLDPTVVVGGSLPILGGANARLGHGELLVCESDESDGSFLWLTPACATVTNIDREHLDHYGGFEGVVDAFAEFSNHISFKGVVVACVDDPELRKLLPRIRRRLITYGLSPDARLRISQARAGASGGTFRLELDGRQLGDFTIPVVGEHNILNATAAVGLALHLGVSADACRSALAAVEGPGRRMELRGSNRGVRVIDDYGHHPTEIRATLKALRLQSAGGRLIVLFQPHRYTRTKSLLDEFTTCFDAADIVRVIDLYAASEQPLEGVSAPALVDRIRAAGHRDVAYAGSLDDGVARVLSEARSGDIVLTLGAGSITQAGSMLLRGLQEAAAGG